MTRARTYAKNIVANWIGYGASLVIMFFMSPFVVHTLGDVQYGVWSLMMSLTGYLGLVEMGTRAGIGRYINYYLGKKDIKSVNATVSTGMAIIAVIGVVLLLAGMTLAMALPSIFPKIPDDLIPAARTITVMVAGNLWLGFLSAPFRHILTAHERFDLTNAVDLLITLLRTAATIAALTSGYGLLMLASIQLAGSVLGQVCMQILARRVLPVLSIRPWRVSRHRARELVRFSMWAFIGATGYSLLYSADAVVIGILLGPEWVTYYAVGGMLVIRVRDILQRTASVFSPRIMQDCAREDWQAIRMQFRLGNNLAMFIGILALVGMVAFAREFIVLWMGLRFEISYSILAILASSSLVEVAFSMAGPIYSGLNRVRLAALLVMAQGLANLGLTLIFVVGFKQGIYGVAWGTFYPRIVFPALVGLTAMRWIGISARQFFSAVGVRWLLLAGTFYLVCVAINLVPMASNWLAFLGKVAMASAIYLPLGWLILLDPQVKQRIRTAIAHRLPAFADRIAA